MKEIAITKGYVALVDDADFEWLSQWKWQASVWQEGKPYAQRIQRLIPGAGAAGPRKRIAMHRAIMGAKPNEVVDHVNGNTLDNRRSNLRICTISQNLCNSAGHRSRLSKYKGVSFFKPGWQRKWRARIGVGKGKQIVVGYYLTELEAAVAYDAAARRLHGEFARVNFPHADFSAEYSAGPAMK